MDHLEKFTSQVRLRLFGLLLINSLIIALGWLIAGQMLGLSGYMLLGAVILIPLLAVTILPWLGTTYLTQPTKIIWQAILHLSPESTSVPPPDLKHITVGRELVTNLVTHVYQLAKVIEEVDKTAGKGHPELHAEFVANSLPLPLIILDHQENIVFANAAMLAYIQRESHDIIGRDLYSALDMSFTSEHTLDAWLENAKKHKAIASQSWERVRLRLPDRKKPLFFDLAAYYSKNNPRGYETMLVLFDHTTQYAQDDQAMSFVALAVHELRTPLTLLRGYIEAFEEELQEKGSLDPQLTNFMHKMKASSQQLSTFINNILNVARIENDHLTLELQKESWPEIVQSVTHSMSLRASVHGIELTSQTDPNLPTVAVDRASIYEVISNLVDNAIKYSGSSKKIVISAHLTHDNRIETTVQDFGVGIHSGAMDNLFDKFYRDHRHRAAVGGTGLGLYLSKAIVTAHGGNIWVRSKEGEGSTFGFTLVPYAELAEERKNNDNKDIVRSTHGWIKNHSLYRR